MMFFLLTLNREMFAGPCINFSRKSLVENLLHNLARNICLWSFTKTVDLLTLLASQQVADNAAVFYIHSVR